MHRQWPKERDGADGGGTVLTGSGDRQRGAELAAQTRWMLPLFGRQFGCLLLSLVHVPASLPQYGFPVPVCVLCIILFLEVFGDGPHV